MGLSLAMDKGDACRVHVPMTPARRTLRKSERYLLQPTKYSQLVAVPTVARLLTAAVTSEGDWYVARCLEVEVASQGRTVEEALANLKEALELYFEDAPAAPPTDPPLVTQIEVRVPA